MLKLANIAWQTLFFVSAMDKKVTSNLRQKQFIGWPVSPDLYLHCYPQILTETPCIYGCRITSLRAWREITQVCHFALMENLKKNCNFHYVQNYRKVYFCMNRVQRVSIQAYRQMTHCCNFDKILPSYITRNSCAEEITLGMLSRHLSTSNVAHMMQA